MKKKVIYKKKEIQSLLEKIKQQEEVVQIKNAEIINLEGIIREKDSISNEKRLDTLFWKLPEEISTNAGKLDLKILWPIAKFENPKGYFLNSKNKRIKIEFCFNDNHYTSYDEKEENNPQIITLEDAIKYYSRGLFNKKITSKNNYFIIEGRNSLNELIFIKGFFEDFWSMQGRDSGEPAWIFSNTMLLKATVREEFKEEYITIATLIRNNFNSNCFVYDQ